MVSMVSVPFRQMSLVGKIADVIERHNIRKAISTIFCLARTCRKFYQVTEAHLYGAVSKTKWSDRSVLRWTIRDRVPDVVKKGIRRIL